MPGQLIRLHAAAPPKPLLGAACNGCGACCASEPCPLAMLLFWRRRGSCPALQWADERYRCGVLAKSPPWLARWVRRWIAAGQGCDFDAELQDEAA